MLTLNKITLTYDTGPDQVYVLQATTTAALTADDGITPLTADDGTTSLTI